MAEVEKQAMDSVEQTVTPEATTESSSTLESGNEENANLSQEVENVDWKKRYSDSSKEAARLKEEAERYKQLAEEHQQRLLAQITKTRETYEEFINEQGLSPQEKEYYMNIYDTQIAPSKLLNENNNAVTEQTGSTPAPSLDQIPRQEDPVRQAWMNRLDSQERERWEEQANATREFFSREENKKLPPLVQESIRATAAMLDQEFGYKPAEALAVARKRLLEPESLIDEGYNEGVRDTMVGGISRGIAGGSARSEETIKLPPRDEAFIQAEAQRKGLKGEAVNELRRKYAERLAQRNR